jgi:hypothetical protein
MTKVKGDVKTREHLPGPAESAHRAGSVDPAGSMAHARPGGMLS